jgi:hypothetical protein
MFREIVSNCPESLQILTEFIVENDLTSSSKAQSNIGFLQFLFIQNPSEVLKVIFSYHSRVYYIYWLVYFSWSLDA